MVLSQGIAVDSRFLDPAFAGVWKGGAGAGPTSAGPGAVWTCTCKPEDSAPLAPPLGLAPPLSCCPGWYQYFSFMIRSFINFVCLHFVCCLPLIVYELVWYYSRACWMACCLHSVDWLQFASLRTHFVIIVRLHFDVVQCDASKFRTTPCGSHIFECTSLLLFALGSCCYSAVVSVTLLKS